MSLIETKGDLDSIKSTRQKLVKLIRDVIEENGDRLTVSQKIDIVNAIGSLGLIVNALVQSMNSWLRLCITAFQKTTGQINYPHVQNHSGISEVDKDELLAARESVDSTLHR